MKTKLWALLEERALQSDLHAAAVYELLSWMAASHLKTEQFKSIALLTSIQQQYPNLSVTKDVKRLKLSAVRTESSNPVQAK